MKFFQKENVWDAALNRIRWLFDEFENVVVNISGGKDSTVCLNLALKVAEEKGRLPLTVLFVDQEAEWQTVIDHVREVMHDPRVNMQWLQVPIKLFNATSTIAPWLNCWAPGDEWIRDKEPDSIHENTFDCDRFAEMFTAYFRSRFPDRKACYIAGVRAEESPTRLNALTQQETYGGETWGKVLDKGRQHFSMYPIYDWSYTDVWKAIHDNKWPYCKLYDYMYQHGVPLANMRVSNVHHETAVKTLFFLQEIESETWNKVTARISGINTAGQMRGDFFKPRELPFMFKDWKEYRDHLIDNLVTDPKIQAYFRKTFAGYDSRYEGKVLEELYRFEIGCILVNDYHGTKLGQFRCAHPGANSTAGSRGGFRTPTIRRRMVNVERGVKDGTAGRATGSAG